MVPDEKLNASVVSGDTIIAVLAKEFKAKKVLLGTDVAGIFTADPKKEKGAKRIPLIDRKNFDSVIEKVSGSKAIDVTGGMRGKLEKLKGLNALVFDATKAGNVFKALAGKKVDGTEIRL
jgi:isopentenyl phosphate kinase